jgi:SAM-dependent methyltransferase
VKEPDAKRPDYVPPNPIDLLRELEVHDLLGYALQKLPPPPARILDVGCGSGHLALALQRQSYDVLAIDEDAEMVAWTSNLGVNATQAAYPHGVAGMFDGIVFSQSLHHMDPVDEVVRETCNKLAPAGVIVVDDVAGSTLDKRGRNFLSETLGLLEKAGIVSHMFVEYRRWPEEGPFDNWEVYFGEGHPPTSSAEDKITEFRRFFDVGEVSRGSLLHRLIIPFLPETDIGVSIAEAIAYIERQRIQDGSLPRLGLRWSGTLVRH